MSRGGNRTDDWAGRHVLWEEAEDSLLFNLKKRRLRGDLAALCNALRRESRGVRWVLLPGNWCQDRNSTKLHCWTEEKILLRILEQNSWRGGWCCVSVSVQSGIGVVPSTTSFNFLLAEKYMSWLSLDIPVFVTGEQQAHRPKKSGGRKENKEGKEKKANSNNHLGRKINLLITTAEIQINWDWR